MDKQSERVKRSAILIRVCENQRSADKVKRAQKSKENIKRKSTNQMRDKTEGVQKIEERRKDCQME